ncbi:lipoprotein, putative [Shewanella violacea DSS12]|uniref:Lipoprotein, putative n=2 Tax=Shewanella violacea TaxID=60217 RepID=D4ZJW2_SHEVD|nr:lipoprotein, putative [Shewanella violacea DSS12]
MSRMSTCEAAHKLEVEMMTFETELIKSARSLSLLVCLSLTACSSLGVEPWQRDQFAREDMALDSEKLDLTLDDHIYFSKEGTSGGRSLAGGGCGCN